MGTRVGWDVICRKGDPTSIHDLIRVNAHLATSILITLTNEDSQNFEESEEKLHNSASLECLMALRHLMYTDADYKTSWHDRRIVVQTLHKSWHMGTILHAPSGKSVVHSMDLRDFLNTLMFECAIKPGLSRVLVELLNFETASFRCRPVAGLHATAENKLGGLIGLTLKEAYNQHCWSAAVLVGVAPRDSSDRTSGIVGDPNRIILEDDHVMFIALHPTPTVSDTGRESWDDWNTMASSFVEQKWATTAGTKVEIESEEDVNVLVCGWRQACNRDSDAVNVTFMNMFDQESFMEHMTAIRAIPDESTLTSMDTPNEWILKGSHHGSPYHIRVTHMVGDAVSEPDLAETLATRAFNVAIVLGTHAMAEDSPEIQDCRVLTCCLLLRQLNSTSKTPIRIVSENNLDQTAFMAIAPSSSGTLADFINTQATFARALVLTAAYPEMGPAVNELFEGGHQQDNGKGRQIQEEVVDGGLRAPEIDLLQSSTLGLAQKNVAFGAVQAILAKMFDKNDMGTVVAVGYYVHVNGTSELVLAPELNSTRLWNDEDQIIVLTREKKRKSKVNRRRMSAAGVSTERQSMASDRSASFEVDSMVLPGTPAASVAVIAPVETDCSSGEPAVADAAGDVLSSPVNPQCDSPPCDSPTEPSSPISEQSSPVDETSTLDSSKM